MSAWAGAGSWCALPVAGPPLVQVLLALFAPRAGQRGGQGVEVVAGQPGQGGVGQGGAVPSGGGYGTNAGTGGSQGRRLLACLPLGGVVALAVAGITVLIAACGGSPSGAGSTAHQTAYQRELAYAGCMRAHGLPGFPDPQSDGTFNSTKANSGDFHGPRFQSANKSCAHLEGPGDGDEVPAGRQTGTEVRGVHARARDSELPGQRRVRGPDRDGCTRRRSQFTAVPVGAAGLPAAAGWLVMSGTAVSEQAARARVCAGRDR